LDSFVIEKLNVQFLTRSALGEPPLIPAGGVICDSVRQGAHRRIWPDALDGWETALWFTTASGWLGDQRPVDLLTREREQVVEAARDAFEEAAA
jgi:hypothetical protein